jgi:hypothetical protein
MLLSISVRDKRRGVDRRSRRRPTSGCTGARALELSGFGQWARAGPVNLDVRLLVASVESRENA